MVNHISKIVAHFFQKDSLDAVSENELRYFITQYPYVGAGHLLLAKKLQLAGEKRAFEREVAVTSVYFTNPAWLEFILREDDSLASLSDEAKVSSTLSASDLDDIRAADADPVEEASVMAEQSSAGQQKHEHHFVVDDSVTIEINHASAAPELTEENPAPVQENSRLITPAYGETQPDETQPDETRPVETQPGMTLPDENAGGTARVLLSADDTAKAVNQKAAETASVLLQAEAIAEAVDENAAETANVLLEAEATAETIDENAAETASVLLDAEDTAEAVDENAADTATVLLEAEATAEAVDENAADTATVLLEAEATAEAVDENAADTATVLLEAEATAEAVDENAADTATVLLEAEATAEAVDENAADTATVLLEAEATAEAIDEKAAETASVLLKAEDKAENARAVQGTMAEVHSPGTPTEADPAEPQPADPTEGREALLHISRAGADAFKAAAASDPGKLAFDPYHTIDYFASQGIKLKLDDLNKDKLGQQLKSFTEWIRSMKRLPAMISENITDDQDQHSIRKIAEHSVEGKDVLTESMAEVWAKQGNYDKARQIYQKLSLQNPSKSTYFAAKIDQLKAL